MLYTIDMHELRTNMLALFKSSDSEMLSTTQIVRRLFPDALRKINNTLGDEVASAESKDEAKREKAKLHRRVLHHVNKLIDEGALSVRRVGAKGEKFFSLKETYNPHVARGFSPSQMPSVPIEGYENKDVLFKFEPDTWIARLNSVFVEATKIKDLRSFQDIISLLFNVINDVIIVNDFESLIERFSVEEVMELFIKLEGAGRDYDKRICLIIDMTNLTKPIRLIRFFEALLPLQLDQITTIFDVTGREMMDNTHAFEELVMLFSKHRLKLNIKNAELHKPPLGIGRAGPYTFEEKEWQRYVKAVYPGKGICYAGVQASVIIDMKQFFDEFQKANLFSDMTQKVAKAMFIANSMQRRHADEYFRGLYDNDLHHDFFALSSMAIRFWNYEFEHPHIDQKGLLELLTTVRKDIRDFCNNEETIYLSCGMPRRFSISLGTAYKRFSHNKRLFEAFEKIYLRSISDIYSKKLRDTLVFRERIGEIFDEGDEVRFQREGSIDPVDIVREFQALLHTYKFPLFCYNFSESAGTTITLTNFLEGGA
jgi:hypothetical protein